MLDETGAHPMADAAKRKEDAAANKECGAGARPMQQRAAKFRRLITMQ